jgi:hypothetical protein
MNLTSIFTGIGAALAVGLVQVVVGPLVEQYVEKEREKRKRRKKMIQDWREMVSDAWRHVRILSLHGAGGDEITSKVTDVVNLEEEVDRRYQLLEAPIPREVLKSDDRFYSLRARMSDEAIRQIKNSDKPTDARGRMPEVLKVVSREIDRIESNWELVETE